MTGWAFLGAGEFQDWHAEVDRALLHGRDGGVLVCATASAPEGDEVFDDWVRQGLGHYERLGVRAAAAPLKRPDDAHDDRVVSLLDETAMVFFSGGNPSYLARVLDASPFWGRLRARLAEGSIAYAGCSAGVACLSDPTYDSDTDDFERIWVRGLGYFPNVLFGPHWDILDDWVPGSRAFITSSTPEGGTLVAIDEGTAMVGDGAEWAVHGAGRVHIYAEGAWTDHDAGSRFAHALPTAEDA
ncbi:MAG TPA: Type 1 glutamine amidotransferase-like domain-containing protein [Actinomycetota bacterium]